MIALYVGIGVVIGVVLHAGFYYVMSRLIFGVINDL